MPGVVAPLPQGKSRFHGIEVAEKVIWKGWEPGREYTRNIVLKNVKVKTQKLKYRGPSTRFFSTLYPQPIVLSAGTSYTLPVTFRPLEKVIYQDSVYFDSQDGPFTIPIHAVLPEMDIEVPDHINFTMCAAEDFRQLTFEIKNCSELETPYRIESQEPFQLEPSEGSLEPYSTVTVTATFNPKAAVVYEADIIIKYGGEYSNYKVTRMEGIGKYPHLLVKANTNQPEGRGTTETVVNFGKVNIGDTLDKWIELCNMSPVNAPFTVVHPIEGATKLDTVFQCLQKEGVVPAMSSVRIPVSFKPSTVDTKSVDYFHIKAIGNISKTIITCIGSSKGPQVHLSQNLVNFLQINSGQVATKTIDIVNQTDGEATFQFQLDCAESVFKFEHVSGTLPPGSKRTIILQFNPIHPINYYRRITCLIHNQGPLFLDVLGTCHTETIKPAVLQAKHLKRHAVHMSRGLSFTPPEHLNQQLQDGTLQVDSQGYFYKPEEEGSGAPSPAPSPAPSTPLSTMDEYFNDGYHSDFIHTKPHVSMDVHMSDFGQCSDVNSVEQQTVNITNHTNGKITVVWMGASDFLAEFGHTFSVSPATLDIPPNSSSPFTVSFKPKSPNQFYGSELECYAYYKSLRDYRLVEDKTQCPPFCMTLLATGHTFQPNNETFLPRYLLDTPDLIFPAVNAHESTYRTLLLSNTGTTPILFDLDKDQEGIFSMKPTRGLLSPSSHQLCVVKCLPTAVKTYKHDIKLHLNAAVKNDQDLTMLGSAESADIQLGEEGVMFFKPTCIGTRSVRTYAVKNISRIPLHYEWKMNHHEGRIISVSPITGLIQPNENQYHTWSFMPISEEKFVMKPALVCWGQGQGTGTSGGKKKQFSIRAIGEGTVGEISCASDYVQFGNIVVGSQATKILVLYNDSACSLEYKLHVDQEIDGPYPDELTGTDPLAVVLEKTCGILPARSRQVIQCTARPSRRVCYKWSVSYQLCTQRGDGIDASLTECRFLCNMVASGEFPTLSITDAHCYGSAVGISKKQLWDLFSLDHLNVSLDSDPSAAEVKYNMATRQSYTRHAPVLTRAVLDFNFSAAPVNSDPCVVQLMLENTGFVDCQWSFLFPNDLQIELEYWAETGEFDDDQLHQMKVMDNKLFSVEPKTGTMKPGECATVSFTYHHIMSGTDRLPVLLKLTRGREILLNFVGVTVDADRRYLHFPSSGFMFSPVSIGEKNPPKQMYELYNGGALTVKYELDTSPLELLKQENFHHDIFEIVNPMGEIVPGQTHAVEWKFSPLEAKTYMVDVPIHIHNGETAIVTFTGVGYDKRALGGTMPVTDNHETSGVPSIQSAGLPGQLCFLSQERLSFGNVPLFTRPRRVVVISNTSQEHGTMFKWHVTSPSDAKIVSIHPREGTLPPGGAQICKITFVSFGFPSFYDIDLICETTNLTDYQHYQAEVEAWYAEKTRQRVEFTIDREQSVTSLTEFREYERKLITWSSEQERQHTDFDVTESDPDADERVSQDSSRPSSRLQALDNPRTPSPEDTDFTKYRTLPPIRQCTLDNERNQERARKRFQDHHWTRPNQPKPFLLHLGVSARTHNVADFQHNFPDEYSNFCVDRTLCDRKENEGQKGLPAERVTCLAAESDVIAGAITDILRGLLDDTQFQESCHKVINAPTPYYRQFTTTRPHTAPPGTATSLTTLQSDVQINVETATTSIQDEGSIRSASPEQSIHECSSPPPAEDEQPTREEETEGRSSAPQVSIQRSGSEASSVRPESSVDDSRHTQRQTLKKFPEFSNTVESVMENTLMNVIQEAFSREFNISARPRLVALLPRKSSANSSMRK